jgi:hypothetical protein
MMNCVIREFHETSVKQTRRFHKANSGLDQDDLNEYCAEHFARLIIERCVELCNKGDDITDYFGLNLYINRRKPRELSPRKSEQVSKLTHALSLMNEVLRDCDSKYANDLENLTEDLDHISDSIECDVLKNIF